MDELSTQILFFQHIKNALPPYISLADDVAEQLHISTDSAYRRIRGEKPISLEEIGKLARHYKLSLDKFLHLESDSFIFNGRITSEADFNYEQWLLNDLAHLEAINKVAQKQFYVLAKEIPFLYYFFIPEIAAFKSYFLKKSIMHYDQMRSTKFSLDDDHSVILQTSKKIADAYAKIPSTEIWHEENITSTLRQNEFYKLTGSIKSNSDAACVLDKMNALLNHIELQAETGKKFTVGNTPNASSPDFVMYINHIIWGDNMIHVDMGKNSITYINHSILNFITTHDEMFNNYTKKTFGIIAAKSTQISSANERDRLVFFNTMHEKISATRKKIL